MTYTETTRHQCHTTFIGGRDSLVTQPPPKPTQQSKRVSKGENKKLVIELLQTGVELDRLAINCKLNLKSETTTHSLLDLLDSKEIFRVWKKTEKGVWCWHYSITKPEHPILSNRPARLAPGESAQQIRALMSKGGSFTSTKIATEINHSSSTTKRTIRQLYKVGELSRKSRKNAGNCEVYFYKATEKIKGES